MVRSSDLILHVGTFGRSDRARCSVHPLFASMIICLTFDSRCAFVNIDDIPGSTRFAHVGALVSQTKLVDAQRNGNLTSRFMPSASFRTWKKQHSGHHLPHPFNIYQLLWTYHFSYRWTPNRKWTEPTTQPKRATNPYIMLAPFHILVPLRSL